MPNSNAAPARITLNLNQIDVFMRFCRRLKNEIIYFEGKGNPTAPPESLPKHVQEFLSAALNIHHESIGPLWLELRYDIWEKDRCMLEPEEFEVFVLHGAKVQSAGSVAKFPLCASSYPVF